MNLKIHRGTREIGGSCVEIWTESTRILVDIGMPLVEKDGCEFDFKKYKDLTVQELIKTGVLPDVDGIYCDKEELIDGILISHAHQDHYGLYNFINPGIRTYLGRATHRLLEINNAFTPQNISISNPEYFEKELPFRIGDITITPFWADHSSFDAYSFLIESEGKSIFYSGDFRGHGRKKKVFEWFSHNAPANVDYLLLEGTSLGRGEGRYKTEWDIEEEFRSLFNVKGKSNVLYTSGQNIDRIVSIYRACLKARKTLVVDVYVATILKELSPFARIPYPSENFENVRVVFPYFTSKRLKNQGDEKILYRFRKYKVTKDEISEDPEEYVLLVRPSMQKDLEYISGIDGGNFIYSMWEGYKSKSSTNRFLKYFKSRNFTFHQIHTSGHADIPTLKTMVDALKPKKIIPIHTFHADEYTKLFGTNVKIVGDGDVLSVL